MYIYIRNRILNMTINKSIIALGILFFTTLNIGLLSKAEGNDLPKHRSHIRIYRNFGTTEEVLRNEYDLSFIPDVKKTDPNHIGLDYELNAYMMVPRNKSLRLKEWWCTQKLQKPIDQCIFPDTWLCDDPEICDIPEDVFLHFKKDTVLTLDLGVTFHYPGTRTGTVKGWDPDNFADIDNDGFIDIDTNKDAIISDNEWDFRPNKQASAKSRQEARVPADYWGNYWEYLTGEPVNHRAIYVMNVGNQDYVYFMSEIYIPNILRENVYADGIYFDNALGSPAHISNSHSEIVEYDNYQNIFYNDNYNLLQAIRNNIPSNTIIIGNNWDNSMPIDGVQNESWLDISFVYKDDILGKSFKDAIDIMKLRDSQGSIYLGQYRPIFDEDYLIMGPQYPVSRERDQIYALSSYYLAAGDRSYFAYGMGPYILDDGNLLFDAIDVDIGTPKGPYFLFSLNGRSNSNVLKNGSFEASDSYGNPSEWAAAEPVTLDSSIKFDGTSSARIDSISTANNNSNGQAITLKPYTTYTLSAFIKTENITGPNSFSGANLYPYDFDDSSPLITGCMGSLKGTNDWTLHYCSFTTGSDVHGSIYYRIMFGTGTAWFDKIELTEGLPRIVLARKYSKALVLVRPRANEEAGYEDPVMYILRNNYRRLYADGRLGVPSNSVTLNSAEGAILVCTRWDGDNYTTGQDCQIPAPLTPGLVSPSNGQIGVDTPVTFQWKQSVYPDEDTIEHRLSYCTNKDFTGCSPIVVSLHSSEDIYYAEMIPFSGFLIGGLIGVVFLRTRNNILLMLVCLLIVGGMLSSCGGGSGGGDGGAVIESISQDSNTINEVSRTTSDVSVTVSGLQSGTTYYWKVTADNGEHMIDSSTWSFTTF